MILTNTFAVDWCESDSKLRGELETVLFRKDKVRLFRGSYFMLIERRG